jgi:hypothetical protein
VSQGAIFAFCRLKELEARLVASVAEGILLGMEAKHMNDFLLGTEGAA